MDDDTLVGWVLGGLVIFVLLIMWAFAFDATELTPISTQFQLLDKWHEEDCIPMYDGNGGYLGESCSDEWTVATLRDGQRGEERVSGSVFREFVIGDQIQETYKKGRLGIAHDKQWQKIGGQG